MYLYNGNVGTVLGKLILSQTILLISTKKNDWYKISGSSRAGEPK
jgi:hypothetical protein